MRYLVTYRSVAHAWRRAFTDSYPAVQLLIDDEKRINLYGKRIAKALMGIIQYERKRRAKSRDGFYLSAPDWVLYKLAYQDALTLFDRIADPGFSKEVRPISGEELTFLENFVELYSYEVISKDEFFMNRDSAAHGYCYTLKNLLDYATRP